MIRAWATAQENNGVVGWPDLERRIEGIRTQAARLLNAHLDEIAFIHSTTHGIGLIAEGYPWRTGDNVVTAEEEYPSNLYPWMNLESRGVSLRQVASRDGRIWIEDLAAAMDRSTRVLAISHVEFASGFRNDLDGLVELCRDRGVARVDKCDPAVPAKFDQTVQVVAKTAGELDVTDGEQARCATGPSRRPVFSKSQIRPSRTSDLPQRGAPRLSRFIHA